MGKFSFTKEEKLSKEIWIKELFKKGSSFNLYPFRILFLANPDQQCRRHQVLISVSIRNFKNAVDRNLLKRRTREAYRLHKQILPDTSRLLIAYIYTAREIEDYEKIQAIVIKSLESILARKIPKIRKESSGK